MLVFFIAMLSGNIGCSPDESNSVTIEYFANGGSVLSSSVTVAEGDHVVLPAPTRRSYVFDGWYNASNGGTMVGTAGDTFTAVTNIKLYAQWISGVTIYFNSNEGSVLPSYKTVLVGDNVVLPMPMRVGYTFCGWHNKQGVLIGTGGDVYIVNGDTVYLGGLIETLRAEWYLDVTVSFNMNGGGMPLPSITAPAGSSITLPTPIRDGYIFNGWYTSLTGAIKAGNAGDSYVIPDGRVTMDLYARWVFGEATVIYNANGGIVSPPSVTVSTGSSVILPIPTRSGYIFMGWFTAASGGTQVGRLDGVFAVDTSLTLYAQWSLMPTGVNVSL